MSQSLLRATQPLSNNHFPDSGHPESELESESTSGTYSKDHVNTDRRLVQTSLDHKKHRGSLQINREALVMKNLLKFYSYTTNLEQLLNILQKQSKISLRILDWFVTNYAKEYCVVYNITKYGRSKQFNVYQSYKAQLKAYHKKLFDPFCRHRRIFFEYSEDSEIETTVGQLNFFQWAISYKVLDYVEKHLERITTHMALKSKEKSEASELASSLAHEETDQFTEQLPAQAQAPRTGTRATSSPSSLHIQATASQEGDETVVQVGFGEK